MAFTFEELPDTAYYHSDLREIIKRLREIDAILASYSKTIAEITERIKQFDDLSDRVTALEKATADLNTIRKDIEYLYSNDVKLEDKINLLQNEYEVWLAKLNELRAYVDSQISLVIADYNYKFDILLAKMNQNKSELERKIDDLFALLDFAIEHLSSDVYNPVWAERMLFDKNNKAIYRDLTYGALTVAEYKELNLKVTDYRKQKLSSVRYYLYGRFDLAKAHWTTGPITGARIRVANAILEVLNFLAGTMTTTEYADLGYTVDEYADLHLTVNAYRFVNQNGKGLTVNQYANINNLNSGILRI